eukprot:5804972-Heterocapsa_arctica.AAC.1
MAISRPLLSVGLLRQMGFDRHLGKQCFLQQGKKQTALVQRGPLFYLPALTIGDVPDAKMTRMTTDARMSMVNRGTELGSTIRFHLIEWCCAANSALSGWVCTHGGTATRSCLPDFDRRKKESGVKVLNEAQEKVRQGVHGNE